MSGRESSEERGAIAREWLPEELTNRGLRVAADPPSEQATKRAATNGSAPAPAPVAAPKPAPAPKRAPAPPKPAPPAPEQRRSFSPEEFERAVRDRVAAVESRLESRLKQALEDLRRAERRAVAQPTPAGNGLTERAPASPAPAAAAPAPEGSGLGPDVDTRLKAAELRVAEAVRATERRVLEVSQLVGALQAIRPENGANGAGARSE
jgi:hypothetical protein